MILQPALALSDHTFASGDTRELIPSRFGEIVVDIRNAMLFPKGILGMAGYRHFALANFPSEKMRGFKLFQCLDDFSISFITLPAASENSIIRREDMLAVGKELSIAENDLLLLLIVCVHRNPDATRLSVNARAPIVIDAARKTGVQHVFLQDTYNVQHFIS